MVAEMVEKPLTEAQRLIARLEGEFGMAQAEIAQAIRVKPDTVFDIKRRKTTGNIQLRQLRRLIAATESSGNPAESAGASFPSFPVPDVSDLSGSAAKISLNGEDLAPEEPKPISERAGEWLRAAMRGTPQVDAPTPRKAKSGDAQADIVDQVTPIAALLLLVAPGYFLAPESYKLCAPQQAEAQAIIEPIVRRVARELDMRGKLSEGTQDIVAVAVATGIYGARAFQTYRQIHAMEVERVRANEPGSPGSHPGGVAGYTAATVANASAGSRGPDASAPLPFGGRARADRQAPGGAGRGQSGGGPTSDVRHADALVDGLLAADAAGRYRLGL